MLPDEEGEHQHGDREDHRRGGDQPPVDGGSADQPGDRGRRGARVLARGQEDGEHGLL